MTNKTGVVFEQKLPLVQKEYFSAVIIDSETLEHSLSVASTDAINPTTTMPHLTRLEKPQAGSAAND